jgi:serine protease Do
MIATFRDRSVRARTLPGLAGFATVLLVALASLSPATASAARGLPDFTGMVKDQSPAVVNISTISRTSGTRGLPRGMDPEDLPEFFRHFFRDMPEGNGGPQQERRSLGSGFILSEDGYVVTNSHVVEDADEIFVRLVDRREFKAEVVGTDPRSDLALLKVDADDLPTVRIGASRDLEVGEWVLAIGSPFGFDYSVTAGIVSAKGRSLPNDDGENYVPFIQTDVAINPGNSGGPLFDLEGRVIGINSQIFTRSGGFMGLSFAIPIDVAMDVVEQLKETGSVARGYLGVLIRSVDRDLAEAFGLDKPSGALVNQVVEDSPAERAGVQPGDIIVEFDGRSIDRSGDLPHEVGRKRPGYEAEMIVIREGARRTLDVTVGELSDPDAEGSGSVAGARGGDNPLGIAVTGLSDEMRQRFGLDSGVQVTRVGDGPAAQAGMQPGDVLTRLNNEPVDSVAAFREAASELPRGRSIPVLIVRRGTPTFIAVRIPE